jgi:hypothetical protein
MQRRLRCQFVQQRFHFFQVAGVETFRKPVADRRKEMASAAKADVRTPAERRSAMRWAQRLKRVFGIDVQICGGCGGTMRIIACIEEPVVIKAILAHPAGKAYSAQHRLPPGRAPPAPAFS